MGPSDAPRVVTDEQLESSVTGAQAVAWMREAVLAAEQGRLTAPARVSADLGGGSLVFTVGALSDEWFGYRSYDTLGLESGDQVVAVQSARTGRVLALAVGSVLGPMRTGALGGLAVDLLAREEATRVGVVGSGRQAWWQLWAIAAVRRVERVSVYSRTRDRAESFTVRVRDQLGLECDAAGAAEDACRGQDVVVLATDSREPVFDPSWLAPGTHVTTLGPKQRGAAEFGLDLVEAADVIVTDSLAQLHAYDPPSLVAGSRHAARVRSLGAVAGDSSAGRGSDADLTLFLSVGLAGTEAHLLARAVQGSG